MLGSPATRWWSTITSRPKAGVLEEGASGTADASQSAEIEAMSRARMTWASGPLDALPLVSMALSFANSEELSVASSRAFTQRWPHAGRNRIVPERNDIIRTRIVFSPSWFRKGWSLHDEDYPLSVAGDSNRGELVGCFLCCRGFPRKAWRPWSGGLY